MTPLLLLLLLLLLWQLLMMIIIKKTSDNNNSNNNRTNNNNKTSSNNKISNNNNNGQTWMTFVRVCLSYATDLKVNSGHRVTATLIFLILLFTILVTPADVIVFVRTTQTAAGTAAAAVATRSSHTFEFLIRLSNVLLLTNFSVNFILYCAVNTQFRTSLRYLVTCQVFKQFKRFTVASTSATTNLTTAAGCVNVAATNYLSSKRFEVSSVNRSVVADDGLDEKSGKSLKMKSFQGKNNTKKAVGEDTFIGGQHEDCGGGSSSGAAVATAVMLKCCDAVDAEM
ncbi:hypothetical protein HELRODRAFT_166533 [Helobdella robusta]|uniref:G-protein coupled receptors family 1 profile domain-containing protein n=1 Tax=Helobdella robusta TaxID=6412 RepID=T1EY79_HELRO|nr:hypothetical protein HELRODRAFT_166533 [Helobdella robusta]ESO11532.1 hypothetical protein HELRODRAFT_166533 [Helobdella robusta]